MPEKSVSLCLRLCGATSHFAYYWPASLPYCISSHVVRDFSLAIVGRYRIASGDIASVSLLSFCASLAVANSEWRWSRQRQELRGLAVSPCLRLRIFRYASPASHLPLYLSRTAHLYLCYYLLTGRPLFSGDANLGGLRVLARWEQAGRTVMLSAASVFYRASS